MKRQSALGGQQINRLPSFNNVRMGRVTSTKDYLKFGKIDVIFLDYSVSMPVWVVNEVDREPVEGDMILVSYIDGQKDNPYMVGFVKNSSYTTNFLTIKKDRVRIQLPVFGIGVKDGKATEDVRGSLLDDDKQPQRAYVEISPSDVLVSFPTSEDAPNRAAFIKLEAGRAVVAFPTDNTEEAGNAYVELKSDQATINFPAGEGAFASVKLNASEANISHPSGTVTHNGGTKGIARLGDTVEVLVDGVLCTGTITSASESSLID